MAKKKVPGFYRTTISISMDLKRRMDKAGSDVNWSAVAARAFESKLAEISAKKEKQNMTDMIQRLRASLQESQSEEYKDGYEAGEEWVREECRGDLLLRLERHRERAGRDWDAMFYQRDTDAWNSAQHLAFAIDHSTDHDRDAAEAFWADILGDQAHRADDPEFVRGFAEGALAIWIEAKSQL